jgi:predicted O-linked N-acetylglucosamine transferase (SPINDLY family)
LNAINNVGIALWELGRLDDAVAACRRAVEINPADAEVRNNLGTALKCMGNVREAIGEHRHALRLAPTLAEAHANLLLDLHYLPDLEPEELFREHLGWDEVHAQPVAGLILPHGNVCTPERRLRIGYVSPDFRVHPVAFFLEGLLGAHEHGQFEIFCYADSAREDGFTEKLRRHPGHWRKIAGMSDDRVAALIREDAIDILVDLAGHTGNNRLLVFARKPAPVQATWLGYCDTTGMKTMDYRITDAFADPPGTTEDLHTEELVRLPESFACFRPAEGAPAVGPLPAMSRGHLTFASFHMLAKLNERLLESWAGILTRVPGSRLMMVAAGLDEETCRRRFVEFFAARGVESGRLEFRARQTLAGYLALHGGVDVLLDSHPFSGHTVSCHALWMGVPVVTLAGRTHCSRMVTSVLMNMGMAGCIARSREQYVEIACGLAADVQRLAALRAGLRERMAASPLMDAKRFARNLEEAYRQMWRKWCRSKTIGLK